MSFQTVAECDRELLDRVGNDHYPREQSPPRLCLRGSGNILDGLIRQSEIKFVVDPSQNFAVAQSLTATHIATLSGDADWKALRSLGSTDFYPEFGTLSDVQGRYRVRRPRHESWKDIQQRL